MAATDACLAQSLVSGLARVGWRGIFSPGNMEVVVSRRGRPFHVFWKSGDRYYEAHGSLGEIMTVLGADTERAEELWNLYYQNRYFRIPPHLVMSTELAGWARHGQPAFSCTGAAFTAWGSGNYYLPYYLGSHSLYFLDEDPGSLPPGGTAMNPPLSTTDLGGEIPSGTWLPPGTRLKPPGPEMPREE